MITIKVEEKIPYTDERILVEASIDPDCYDGNKRYQAELLHQTVETLQKQASTRVKEVMEDRNIVLGEDGMRIQ